VRCPGGGVGRSPPGVVVPRNPAADRRRAVGGRRRCLGRAWLRGRDGGRTGRPPALDARGSADAAGVRGGAMGAGMAPVGARSRGAPGNGHAGRAIVAAGRARSQVAGVRRRAGALLRTPAADGARLGESADRLDGTFLPRHGQQRLQHRPLASTAHRGGRPTAGHPQHQLPVPVSTDRRSQRTPASDGARGVRHRAARQQRNRGGRPRPQAGDAVHGSA
jgi:hypothetical protein